MHYRLVAVITAALLFLTIPASLAQGYSIRADAKINLRSWYSTTASIVETVPAGTVLQVIGSFNRWLNIDRSGNDVWMADWVNFTRIQDGGAAAVSQPESQETAPQTRGAIDNCCFVDRQCNTDDEWIEWLYGHFRTISVPLHRRLCRRPCPSRQDRRRLRNHKAQSTTTASRFGLA